MRWNAERPPASGETDPELWSLTERKKGTGSPDESDIEWQSGARRRRKARSRKTDTGGQDGSES